MVHHPLVGSSAVYLGEIAVVIIVVGVGVQLADVQFASLVNRLRG